MYKFKFNLVVICTILNVCYLIQHKTVAFITKIYVIFISEILIYEKRIYCNIKIDFMNKRVLLSTDIKSIIKWIFLPSVRLYLNFVGFYKLFVK